MTVTKSSGPRPPLSLSDQGVPYGLKAFTEVHRRSVESRWDRTRHIVCSSGPHHYHRNVSFSLWYLGRRPKPPHAELSFTPTRSVLGPNQDLIRVC